MPAARFIVVVIKSSRFADRARRRVVQRQSLGFRIRSQDAHRTSSTRRPQQCFHFLHVETKTELAHLAAELLTVVPQEVGDHEAAARAKDARGLRQNRGRVLDVGEGKQEQRAIAGARVQRQRFEAPLLQLDVLQPAVRRRAALSMAAD